MGMIRNRRSGRDHALASQFLVGRGPACNLRLASPMASAHHAELRWTGAVWELRDLDSRNNTYVDHDPLKKGERRKLLRGSLIAFGDPEDVYELTADDPPGASATCADGRRQDAQAGTLLLPDPDAPQCFVHQTAGGWSIELSDGSVRPAASGETITIDGHEWTLDLPLAFEPTQRRDALTLENATLRFAVSRNEEHVELELIDGDRREHLPARVYWYTLLTLARARLGDRGTPDTSEAEEGWMYVEQLTERDLQMDPGLLYQHVCRIKRALKRAGVVDYSGIVERRPNARQIRIGARKLEVVSL